MYKYYETYENGPLQILVTSSKETVKYCEARYNRVSYNHIMKNLDCLLIDNDGQEMFADLLPSKERAKKTIKRAARHLENIVYMYTSY